MKRKTLKKSVSLLIAAVMLLAALSLPIGAEETTAEASTIKRDDSWIIDGKGNGPEDALIISTPGHLISFANKRGSLANKYIKLGADIDLNPGYKGEAEAPSNLWVDADVAFSGTFDGDGYTISGIYLTTPDRAGIFGAELQGTLTVKNLSIVNSYVEGKAQYVGGIIGLTTSSCGAFTVDNVYMDINVKSTVASGDAMCGGILGRVGATSAAMNINNCVVAGDIVCSGVNRVGGFIGVTETSNNNVSISSSAFYGNIKINNTGRVDYISGLVGVVTKQTAGFTVDNCIMAGNITFATPDVEENCGNVLKSSNGSETLSVTNCLYVDIYNDNKVINPTASKNITLTDNAEIVVENITGLAALAVIDQNEWKASPQNGYPLPAPVYYMLYDVASDNVGTGLTKFVGYQTSKAVDGVYSIRLVAVLTSEEYEQLSKLGLAVTLDASKGGVTKSASQTREINTIYTSILANDGSTNETLTYTAEALGGEYIFAAIIENIPTSLDALTVTVTTFHVEKGSDVQVAGSTSKVTINTSYLTGDAQ